MTGGFSPERWAFEITHVLNAVLGPEHFPVHVPMIAKEYSAQRFPDDPAVRVVGENLPGFDGALYPAPPGKKGWGIFYNNGIASVGRMNFTLAHEFGHYLVHRLTHPEGIQCGEQDTVRWDSEYGQIEHQANVFAANLLMPLDDYKRQIPVRAAVDLDQLSHCAHRYRVSLVAVMLRWISYTEKRALIVVSRDGHILWSRSSAAALKTGAFFRTSRGPIEIPADSAPVRTGLLTNGRATVEHDAGIWLREPVKEVTVVTEQYDFAISLLLLRDEPPVFATDAPDEPDVYDRFAPRPVRRQW